MSLSIFRSLADTVYTYNTTTTSSSFGATYWITVLILWVIYIVALWKVFTKAGKPGWAAIVPIYNVWVLFEMAGKPGWWSLLFLIPFVNFIAFILLIIAFVEIAKRFGQSGWFAILFFILGIGWFILGFGKAQYQGGGAAPTQPAAPAAPAPPAAPAA